jgi:hypothetical protein
MLRIVPACMTQLRRCEVPVATTTATPALRTAPSNAADMCDSTRTNLTPGELQRDLSADRPDITKKPVLVP